eukprot:scaffold2223_cov153-Isochrysis_galbana.AAC.1
MGILALILSLIALLVALCKRNTTSSPTFSSRPGVELKNNAAQSPPREGRGQIAGAALHRGSCRARVAHSVPLAASGTDICGAAFEPELFVAQRDVPCKATDPRAAMDTSAAATYV